MRATVPVSKVNKRNDTETEEMRRGSDGSRKRWKGRKK